MRSDVEHYTSNPCRLGCGGILLGLGVSLAIPGTWTYMDGFGIVVGVELTHVTTDVIVASHHPPRQPVHPPKRMDRFGCHWWAKNCSSALLCSLLAVMARHKLWNLK